MDKYLLDETVSSLRNLWINGHFSDKEILDALNELLIGHPNYKPAEELKADIIKTRSKGKYKPPSAPFKFKGSRAVICLAIIFFILIFGYFHPTRETMTCDENLVCTV